MNGRRVGKVVDLRGSVNLEDRVLSDKDSDILIVGRFLPIVPIIKGGDKKVRWLIVMGVPHRSWRKIDCIIWVLVVRSADIDDIRVCSLESFVEIFETEGIVFPEPVFVSNLNILDIEWFWMSILRSLSTPIRTDWPSAELELIQCLFQERI